MDDDFKQEKKTDILNKIIDLLEINLDEFVINNSIRKQLDHIIDEVLELFFVSYKEDEESNSEPLDFFSDMDSFEDTEEE